jgi:hypothetical protein
MIHVLSVRTPDKIDDPIQLNYFFESSQFLSQLAMIYSKSASLTDAGKLLLPNRVYTVTTDDPQALLLVAVIAPKSSLHGSIQSNEERLCRHLSGIGLSEMEVQGFGLLFTLSAMRCGPLETVSTFLESCIAVRFPLVQACHIGADGAYLYDITLCKEFDPTKAALSSVHAVEAHQILPICNVDGYMIIDYVLSRFESVLSPKQLEQLQDLQTDTASETMVDFVKIIDQMYGFLIDSVAHLPVEQVLGESLISEDSIEFQRIYTLFFNYLITKCK